MAFESTLRSKALVAALAATALTAFVPSKASAEAMLLIEADSGKVLHAENATYPWYPASVTKILTAYVTLQSIKNGRHTLDSLLTFSPRAAAQAPSKIGFKPGTQVTIDNALKMLFVIAGFATRANAEALLAIEVDSGKVLHAENATYPWYPASVTKILTAYVTLQSVKNGRLTLDSPVSYTHLTLPTNREV